VLDASSGIWPYWPASPSFDPQRVFLIRLFFIYSDRTKYVSVSFYPARDYKLLVEFGVIRRGGSKSILFTEERIDTLTDCLSKMLVSICNGGTDAAAVWCKSGFFRLSLPKIYGSTRLYFGT